MNSPALMALQAPSQVPTAAVGRLEATAETLMMESLLASAGLYADLLARLATIAHRVAPIVKAALTSTANDAELTALANAERIAQSAEALFNEIAKRSTRRARIYAMQWAQLARRLWSDISLLRREFAATAYLGADLTQAWMTAPVRILPGAEHALMTLARDPLVSGAEWDPLALADTLTRWVQVT